MLALKTLTARVAPAATRSFASSPRVLGTGSHVSNNDPEVLEREKNRNLSSKQHGTSSPHPKHAPGWNEPLASVSEANIKADQAEITSPEELTKVTIEYVTKRHEDGSTDVIQKATSDVLQATHKNADRDEVEGPLKKAGRS